MHDEIVYIGTKLQETILQSARSEKLSIKEFENQDEGLEYVTTKNPKVIILQHESAQNKFVEEKVNYDLEKSIKELKDENSIMLLYHRGLANYKIASFLNKKINGFIDREKFKVPKDFTDTILNYIRR